MAGRVRLTEARRKFLQMHVRSDLATKGGFLKRVNARKTYVFVRACRDAGIIHIVDPKNYFPYSWDGTQITPAGRAILSEGKASDATT